MNRFTENEIKLILSKELILFSKIKEGSKLNFFDIKNNLKSNPRSEGLIEFIDNLGWEEIEPYIEEEKDKDIKHIALFRIVQKENIDISSAENKVKLAIDIKEGKYDNTLSKIIDRETRKYPNIKKIFF